jgi:hypothetical protein
LIENVVDVTGRDAEGDAMQRSLAAEQRDAVFAQLAEDDGGKTFLNLVSTIKTFFFVTASFGRMSLG